MTIFFSPIRSKVIVLSLAEISADQKGSVPAQCQFLGTIYFDTFPDRVDPARECAANVKTVQRMLRLLDRVPLKELRQAQAGQDAVTALHIMQGLYFND